MLAGCGIIASRVFVFVSATVARCVSLLYFMELPHPICWLPRDVLNLIRGYLGIENLIVLRFVRPFRCIEGSTTGKRLKSLADISPSGITAYKLITWLRTYLHFPWCVELPALAASCGRPDVLTWLRKEGCPSDESTFAAAAARDDVPTLLYLHDNGYKWDDRVCEAAARHGHIRALAWCRTHGCPMDHNAAIAAAAGGHVDVLKWLVEFGCHIPREIWTVASRVEVLEYLSRRTSMPQGYGTMEVMVNAVIKGNVAVLDWYLPHQHTSFGSFALLIAGRRMLKKAAWRPFPCTVWSWAVLFDRFEVLEWAKASNIPLSEDAWWLARKHQKRAVMTWYESIIKCCA